MIFIKSKVTNTHNVFQHLLFLMLFILFSLPCLAQNENIQTTDIPNLIQIIDITTSQILFIPDHLFNEKNGWNNKYDKQVIIQTDKALNRIIKQQEQQIQITDIADSITVCIQNCTEMIESYFMDRKLEIKQHLNTIQVIIHLRVCWIRSAGVCISISDHVLHLKKHIVTLIKMKPKPQSICRIFPPFINTLQRTVPLQYFIPPKHITI